MQHRDWQDYREIRLAALKDTPSAFAATWQQEAALTESLWMERAQRSEEGDTATIVVAVDDDGRWVGLAGGYRPGDRGADAELISMWVAPDCRGQSDNGVVDDHPGTAVAHDRCRPGHRCGHDRQAAQPRLNQHARHTLARGPTGEDEHV